RPGAGGRCDQGAASRCRRLLHPINRRSCRRPRAPPHPPATGPCRCGSRHLPAASLAGPHGRPPRRENRLRRLHRGDRSKRRCVAAGSADR
ncbi:hypothetical protein HK405_000976, partial [Cladochytrium tenue]